jgi:hypothetical protein
MHATNYHVFFDADNNSSPVFRTPLLLSRERIMIETGGFTNNRNWLVMGAGFGSINVSKNHIGNRT